MAKKRLYVSAKTEVTGLNTEFSKYIALHDYIEDLLPYIAIPASTTTNLNAVLLVGNQTGAADIVMTAGQKIGSSSGTAMLDLQGDGADNTYVLSSDGQGAYTGSWIWGDASYLSIGFGSPTNAEIAVSADAANIRATSTGMIGIPMVHISPAEFGVKDTGTLDPFAAILIKDNAAGPVASSGMVNAGVFLNSGITGTVSTINTGIDHSVALGGVGLTIKLNNTPYANQFALQQSGNLKETIFVPKAGALIDSIINVPTIAVASLSVVSTVEIIATPATAVDGQTMLVDTTVAGGAVTVNMPTVTANQRVTVKNVAGANTITLDGNGSEEIDFVLTYVLLGTVGNFVTVESHNTLGWLVVAERNV